MARARTDLGRDSAMSNSSSATIGRSTRVRGRVTGDGSLVVEGTVEGDITLRGDLMIAEGARSSSNIDAEAVTVRGELEGDIAARGIVRIESGARVRGDVRGESVAIEDGAEFSGRLDADFELPAELGSARGGRR